MTMNKLLLSTALSLGLALPAIAATVAEGDKLSDNQNYTYWLLDAIKSMDPQINTDVEGSGIMRSPGLVAAAIPDPTLIMLAWAAVAPAAASSRMRDMTKML